MEKKPESIYRVVEGIRLKRSDLRDLAEIIGDRDGVGVQVGTADYRFRDIEELIAFREPVAEIEIRRSHRPGYGSASVKVRGNSVDVYFGDVDDTERGAAARLDEIIRSRRRRLYPFETNFYFVPVTFVGLSGTILGMALSKGRPQQPMTAASISFVSLVLMLSALIPFVFAPKSWGSVKFRPEDGERVPIKWRAVWWDIFKAVLPAIAGGILGYLIRGKP